MCDENMNLEEQVTEQPVEPKVETEPLFEEMVDFDTFSKSDFRVVKVKECSAVKKSKKLLHFVLDDGTGIDLYNTSDTRGTSQSYGLNYQKTGKELMSQDEIAVMDGSKCIMQLRGVRPFFSDKFDITKHKQYPLLSDYDKKNEFDIEKYVKNRNRLRFKRNDVVDEVCDVGEITA